MKETCYIKTITIDFVETTVNSNRYLLAEFGYYDEERRGDFIQTKALKADLRGNFYVISNDELVWVGTQMSQAVDEYNKLRFWKWQWKDFQKYNFIFAIGIYKHQNENYDFKISNGGEKGETINDLTIRDILSLINLLICIQESIYKTNINFRLINNLNNILFAKDF